MPGDLPPDEFGQMATVMLRLHADFRKRHGLPPVWSEWTLLEGLEDLKPRSALNEPVVLASPRAGIGPALEALRRVLWKILKPVFDRQTEVNRDVIRALEALMRDRQKNRQADHALSLRISEIEMAIARLDERDK
jgi:hypothetical protein